jgi:integrase/recombinase XerD
MFDHVETKIQLAEPRTAQLYVLDAAIMRFLYGTALRVSEATYLRLSMLVRQDGYRGFQVVRKGGREMFYPVSGSVEEAYERWMRLRSHLVVPPRYRDFVFVHPWTGRRLSRRRSWNRLRRIAEEAGLPEEICNQISAHKLRHAKAYHELEAGTPISAVQSLLGHASITSTQEYIEDDERSRVAAIVRASRG